MVVMYQWRKHANAHLALERCQALTQAGLDSPDLTTPLAVSLVCPSDEIDTPGANRSTQGPVLEKSLHKKARNIFQSCVQAHGMLGLVP
jgi:hypothetical protein